MESDLGRGEPFDDSHGPIAKRTGARKRGPEDRLQPGLKRGAILVRRSATEYKVAGMQHDAGWRGSRNCECEQSRAEADATGSGAGILHWHRHQPLLVVMGGIRIGDIMLRFP
jgi:hypothetical protein